MKKLIKSLIYFLLNTLLFFKSYASRACVLMYHSVGNNKAFFNVGPRDFAKQMAYLKINNFKVISLSRLIDLVKSNSLIEPKTVVLTFDDGYLDNYLNVWPLLKKHNFPATIFIAPYLIDKKDQEFEKLDWRQIKQMNQLVDFEPHGFFHKELAKVSLDEAEEEIKRSKEIIEKELDKKCLSFCYPRGSYNEQITDLLKKYDFKAGLTADSGLVDKNTDLFKLPRQSINSETNMIQFKGKLKFNFRLFK